MFKKLKNNKGEAESILFVFGMTLFVILVTFSLNVFDLTWQRYVVKREVENVSRIYAIKWTELYKIPDCDGSLGTCSYSTIKSSDLGKDLIKLLEVTVEEGNLNTAELAVGRTPNAKCNESGTLLCIKANKDGTSSISGRGFDEVKQMEYGTPLYSSLTVSYSWKNNLRIPSSNSGYTINNKFANERHANDSDLID